MLAGLRRLLDDARREVRVEPCRCAGVNGALERLQTAARAVCLGNEPGSAAHHVAEGIRHAVHEVRRHIEGEK